MCSTLRLASYLFFAILLSPVVFQNNPFCGLLILIGLFVQSTRVAVYGIIGLFCGTLIAYTLGFDNGLKRSGLFGYNSLLCGLAMATFYSSEQYQGYSTAVAISTIIFSCFSSVLFIFMGKLLAPYKSPPFTLPFNASVIMYLLATANMTRVNTGSVRVPMLPEYDVEFDTALTASDFFAGCVRGVGQIFLADNIVSGVLVLVGIAICSRISAFAALAGSALGAAAAVASGVPGADVTAGMYGFNSSLTFIAMYMFYTPSRGAFVLATFAGIMTVLAQLALAPWLQPYGLPFLTLPFCVVSLPFVVLQGTTSLVIAVPLSSMTVPEDHLKKVRYLSDGFAFLTEAINPNNTREFRRRESSIVHSKHFRSSMKEISRILEKEEELVDEELSLAFSNHSDRSKASTSYVSTTSFIQKFITKCRKKSIKGGWVLKEAPKIFKELDAKNQGSIFLEDFTSALRTVGLNDKTGLRFASLVFDIIDSDKSKSIERKEFVVFCVVSAKLLEVRKKISKFFDFVDVDGNEYIDFDEINAALEYLNEPPLSDADQDTLLSVIAVEDEEEGMDIVEIINYVTVAKVKAMMDDYRQHQTENESLHSISIDMNDTA
jgi:urea transporter